MLARSVRPERETSFDRIWPMPDSRFYISLNKNSYDLGRGLDPLRVNEFTAALFISLISLSLISEINVSTDLPLNEPTSHSLSLTQSDLSISNICLVNSSSVIPDIT